MKSKILYIGLIITIFIPFALNAVSQATTLFLTFDPSSRAGAMGSAYVAQVDDAFAGYWNPAAMAFNRKTQFAGLHTNWLGDAKGIDDMYYEFLAWNQYFQDIGNIGFNITFITEGKQEQTDESGDYQGTFSSWETALATSYAFQLNQNTSLGLTFKFIYSDLAPAGTGNTESDVKGQGMSYAFDLGFKRKNLFIHGFDIGINFQNIGPDLTYINADQADPLPMTWKMGFSYRILESQLNKFTVNADVNKILANEDPLFKQMITGWGGDKPVLCSGAEYVYLDLISLRGGYFYDKSGDIIGASFGAGIHYTFSKRYKLSFDFAMQPAGGLTDYNKTISAKVEF